MDFTTVVKPGKHALNLSGGAAAWQTMNAMVQEVTIEFINSPATGITSGKTTVKCGPVAHLEPGQLVQLTNAFGNRDFTKINPNERISGLVNGGLNAAMPDNTAKENTTLAQPDSAYQIFSAPDAGDGTKTNSIQHDPANGRWLLNQLVNSTGAVNAAAPSVTIAQAGMTSATGNVLGGSVVINNGEGGAAQTFVMGSAAYSGNGTHAIQGSGPNTSTWTINGDTMDDLKQAINLDSADLGITATDNSGVGKGITLAMGGTAYGSSISVNSTTLTDNYATSLLNPVASGGSGTSGTLAMTANGGQSVAMAGAALNGTVVLANTVGGTTTVTDTFVMGSNGSSAGTNNTWDVSGNTEGALLSAINAAGTYGVSTGDLHVTATLDSNTGGIKIASLGVADTNLTMSTSATANVTEANTVGTQGQVQGYQTQGYAAGSVSTPSTVTFGGSGFFSGSFGFSLGFSSLVTVMLWIF